MGSLWHPVGLVMVIISVMGTRHSNSKNNITCNIDNYSDGRTPHENLSNLSVSESGCLCVCV